MVPRLRYFFRQIEATAGTKRTKPGSHILAHPCTERRQERLHVLPVLLHSLCRVHAAAFWEELHSGRGKLSLGDWWRGFEIASQLWRGVSVAAAARVGSGSDVRSLGGASELRRVHSSLRLCWYADIRNCCVLEIPKSVWTLDCKGYVSKLFWWATI